MSYTLPRSERLRSLKAIRRMFGEGRGGFVYPYRYIWIADKQEGVAEGRGIEVMFSVPKKFHKRANKRNLLKRRTREAYRLQKLPLVARAEERGLHLDIGLIYSTKEILDYKIVSDAIGQILEKIGSRL